MAIITGLNSSRYYVDNPIWVDVDRSLDADPDEPVLMNITINNNVVFSSKYYTFNGKVSFDLSEIIKGYLPEPNHPVNPSSGDVISLSTVQTSIYLPDNTYNKTFFRGGQESDNTNIAVPNNAVLKESVKIPIWDGFPSAKYYLNDNGQIIFTNILSALETVKMRNPTCNPVFLRFLNTKGGYSFWLFEDWDISKTSKTTETIERRGNDLDLGLTNTNELNVSSRVGEDYTPTLRALLQSPDVYIYKIGGIYRNSSTKEWTKIYNNGGSMKWNSYDSVNEFSFSFDLRFKNNSTLIW